MASGTMVKLAASDGEIDTTDQCNIFEAYGKIFVVNGSILRVADFTNTKIATNAVGTNPPDRGNILTGGGGGAVMVVDYITSLSGACTLYGKRTSTETFASGETVTGTDDDGNAISFVLTADEVAPNPPHWYTWTVYGGDETNYGSLPDIAYIGCLSSGRCILSGDPNYPHQAPTSAAGNPWDWNIYRTTSDRATVIGTGSAGAIGDVVRALIPVEDGRLIVGCANSMHVVVDNPAYGGQIFSINGTGIFGAHSYCFDGAGNLYFWGTGGVNRIPKGAAYVDHISLGPLPNLVADIAADPATHRVTMGYDPDRGGVKMAVTLLSSGSNSNYWVDLHTDPIGFFPDTHADEHGVYSMFYYNSNDPSLSGLLCGCTDGYLRVHSDTAKDDDGEAIDSYVGFGPIQLAEVGKDGSIAAFDLVLAGAATGDDDASDDVTLSVWSEDTAQQILKKMGAGTGPRVVVSFDGPGRARGSKKRRGVRGAYAGIKIGNNQVDESWGMEKLIVDAGSPGRRLR